MDINPAPVGTAQQRFLGEVSDDIVASSHAAALRKLAGLVSLDQYIGDLLNLDFDSADILIHDSHKIRVNGIPHGCLLVASRLRPDQQFPTNPAHVDSSLLLLRVSSSTRLNADIDLDKTRFEIVKRSNDSSHHYDEARQTDQFTLNLLRYSGFRCRILGTFRLYQTETNADWQLHFGADIDNFYAGQGLKIYKPIGEALRRIVNYRSGEPFQALATRIGRLRYSAAIKEESTPESVPVEVSAQDFIAQRTALFGMTRTGKSNTTKTIASALFLLRQVQQGERVGQLIFDPNGEYANDNPQDQGCLRNVKYKSPDFLKDVQTYGSHPHPNDTGRHITKFNFFGEFEPVSPPSADELEEMLHTLYRGKEVINDTLAEENTGYIQAFCNASVRPDGDCVNDHGEYTRLRRRLFVYRGLLADVGFSYVPRSRANTKNLFNKDLRKVMAESNTMKQFVPAIESGEMAWEVVGDFTQAFAKWVKESDFQNFDSAYASGHDGRKWSDSHLIGLLRFHENTRGRSFMQKARDWHDLNSTADYADMIVNQVREGKLVIVDQLLGDPDMNRQAAERIASQLFRAQQASFSNPQKDSRGEIVQPPPVILYAEEAHTLLPKSSDEDNNNIWARIAKEGAKFNIGLVYSTQEPSSLQANILKNTENWFIAHLNNTDETNQLRKFNDFADFTNGIINVREAGLIKVRTQSSPFTIPVYMDKFTAPPPQPEGQVSPNGLGYAH